MKTLSTITQVVPDLDALAKCDALVIAFTNSGAPHFLLQKSQQVAIEKLFDLELTDELSFYSPGAKAGESFEFPVSAPRFKFERIILLNCGDGSRSSIRLAGAALGRRVRGKEITVGMISALTSDETEAFATSLQLGAFYWNQKSDQKNHAPKILIATKHADAISRSLIVGAAVNRARELIHTPANIKTPAWMAAQAASLAKRNNLKIEVLSGKQLLPFGGLYAVGNSSPKPGPRFIKLSYVPKRGSKNAPHVVIVGKGITFDTGGVSLKRPYDFMIPMKSDMAGAAAALSTISALPALAPQVRVTVLMMCAENAVSGTAQRPSDVITQYGGKTVEVINTDAEGRLVLADGLAYADKHLDPDYLIDIATLTGAATLGLGRHHGALYTRDATWAKSLMKIGEKSGDRIWHMPLIDDYKDSLESDVADLNHNASAQDYSAGSVTAALFLEHFAAGRRWAHLDIAGTARSESDAGENPKGGTGFGVRLLIDWITSL